MLMLDSDVIVNWEGNKFDPPAYLRTRGHEPVALSAIGYADTLIAAAALAQGAELLTFNRAEFDPNLATASAPSVRRQGGRA